MKAPDNRLIVIRAWVDADRLIIRIISSAGPQAPAVESVFSDIDSATERLVNVLTELLKPVIQPAIGSSPTRRQSVDAPAASDQPS